MIDDFLFKQLPAIDIAIRDAIIKTFLNDNPNYVLEVATTTGAGTTTHCVARIIFIYSRQRSPVIECRANEREKALDILAFQLAAIQLPSAELAYIFQWMQGNQNTATDLLINIPQPGPHGLFFWRAMLGATSETSVMSSQELTITDAIEDLATELLVFQEKQIATATENVDGA